MSNITILGIDLAKNIFQLHGADSKGKCIKRLRLSRKKLAEYVTNLPVCTIAMESCSGSNYWARKFKLMGHTVKLIAPQFVKPYVKSNKTDRNDAEAIAEAASRPGMRFVPIKEVEQQDMQSVHRSRELFVKQRTMLANHMRGLLGEYGVIMGKGLGQLRKNFALLIEKEGTELTAKGRENMQVLLESFRKLDKQVTYYDKQIEKMAKADERCKALMEVPGVGPLTATAALAAIGDGKEFKRGREASAWVGLVPKQHSSGNKIRLQGISKRGDRYLRTLLVHGARSVVNVCERKTDKRNVWVAGLKKLKGHNKAAVALANKNMRIIWSILSTGECYRKPESVVA